MAVERVLPDATIEIYFNLGTQGRHLYGGNPRAPLMPRASWVLGPHDSPFLIAKETIDSDVVGLRCSAVNARQVLGVDASELRGQMIDLDCFWGNDAESLRDELACAGSVESRLGIVERAVLSRIRGTITRQAPCGAPILGAVRDNPQASIASLARQHDASHRRLIEIVERATGLKPKALQRVMRLRRTLAYIHEHNRKPWAHIANACGYYDQAHLINDFRLMSGMTPAEYESTRSSVGVGVAPFILASDLAGSMVAVH
jgi:AraC-like DNA-binding protein